MKTSVIISTDPIADMLSRIRNAAMVNAHQTRLPHSKAKENVAKILASQGFLKNVSVTEDNGRKTLVIEINAEDEPAKITALKRLSRPGRRMYVKADDIPVVKRGRGMVVVSTSSGMMSGQDAQAKRLGGELICEVY